jgi:hypothetical protein
MVPQASNSSAPIGNYTIVPTAAVAGLTGVGNISNYNVTYTNGTLHVLEALSTTVNLASDTTDAYDNLVSLREAFQYASLLAGNQSISIDNSLYSANTAIFTFTGGPIPVNSPSGTISISGPSTSSGNSLILSGNNTSGLFSLTSPLHLTNLTLTGANGSGLSAGGAIYSTSTLRLENVLITNSTASAGEALYQNGGSATIINSTIANSILITGGANLAISGSSIPSPLAIANGGQISLLANQAVSLGQIRAGGLNINTTVGNISQAANSNITVSGNAIISSAGTIHLTNSTNSFGSLVLNSPQTMMTVNGTMNISSMQVANMTLTGNGSVLQTPGTNLVVTGTANFNVSGNLVLNNTTNNFSGPIIVSGNAITIYNSGNSNLASVNANDLTFSTSGGDIRQSGQIVVRNANTSYLTATGGNIILTNTTNDFVGGIYANATNHIEIYNSNASILGNISAASFRFISAGGNISQVSGTSISVAGLSDLLASGNSIILNQPTNDLGTLSATAQNLTIAESNNLSLTNITISSTVNITLANQVSVVSGYVAPLTIIGNGTLATSAQIQTNLTISGGAANIQTGGNVTGATVVNSGSLYSNGSFSTVVLNNGTLYTTGSGTTVQSAFTINNNATWVAGGGSLADFGRITSPSLTISPNSSLIVNLPQKLNYGNSLTIIDNTGSSAISGTFSGLPQNTIFVTNGTTATAVKLNYLAGTGNDMQVTVPGGIINVLTTNLTATANSQYASNLTFRVLGGPGNTTGIANVPFTITLPADSQNSNTASARFDQANVSNRSVSVVSDVNGNVSVPLWANNNPGVFQVNITKSDEPSVYSYPFMGVVGVAVQRQSINRSTVRYLDVVLSSSNLTELNYDVNNFLANFTLTRTRTASFSGGSIISDPRNYLANGPSTASIYTTPVGFTIDFGTNGLGNQTNSAVFDGVYQLGNKAGASVIPSNTAYSFHRLLGDVNGDNVVDALDQSLIQTVLARPAWRYQNASNLTYVDGNMSSTSVNPVATWLWVGDVNGDGKINALDLNIVTFQRGRRVNYTRKVT